MKKMILTTITFLFFGFLSAGDLSFSLNSSHGIATWLDNTNQLINIAFFNTATQAWASSSPLSTPGHYPSDPQVALSDSGNAVIIWHDYDPLFNYTLQGSYYNLLTNSWTTPAAITVSNEIPFNSIVLRITNDQNQTAVVTWQAILNNEVIIRSSYITAGNSWSTPVTISN